MQGFWLQHHQGSHLPDGSSLASPGGVDQCLSHLSTGFDQLGRVGPWSSTTTHGNPILSTIIGNYRKGYRLQAWHSGYLEGSAVALTEDKVFQLVAYIDSLQPASTSPTAALALDKMLSWFYCCGKAAEEETTLDVSACQTSSLCQDSLCISHYPEPYSRVIKCSWHQNHQGE